MIDGLENFIRKNKETIEKGVESNVNIEIYETEINRMVKCFGFYLKMATAMKKFNRVK